MVVVADAGLGTHGLSRAVKGATAGLPHRHRQGPGSRLGAGLAGTADQRPGPPNRPPSTPRRRDLAPRLGTPGHEAASHKGMPGVGQIIRWSWRTLMRRPPCSSPRVPPVPPRASLYTHRQLAAMRDTVAATLGIRSGAAPRGGFRAVRPAGAGAGRRLGDARHGRDCPPHADGPSPGRRRGGH